jgi:hypothetical protein
MIEDPLIFTAIGANWFIKVSVRLTLGLGIILLASRLWKAAPAEKTDSGPED